MSNDMTAHLARQAVFSRATFGPGPRTYGVLDHITKEQAEVRACYPHPADPLAETTPAHHEDAAKEWTDIAILGLDGLLRAVWAAHPAYTADQVAVVAFGMIREKQGRNEMRTWPDWRGADPDKAIEHDRRAEVGFAAPDRPRTALPVENVVDAAKARIAEITGVTTDLLGNPEPTVTTRLRAGE